MLKTSLGRLTMLQHTSMTVMRTTARPVGQVSAQRCSRCGLGRHARRLYSGTARRSDDSIDQRRSRINRAAKEGKTPDAAASRTAFEQRTILDQLRSAQGSSSNASPSQSPSGAKSVPIGRVQPTSQYINAGAVSESGAGGGATSALPGSGLGLGVMRNPLGIGSSGGMGTWDRLSGGGKEWAKLKGGEKIFRASLNTSRLTLVLIGGTLTLAVFWTVSTELFASNSPTVIFEDACKRIKKSEEIHQYLIPPLRFHARGTTTASSSEDAPTTLHFRISSKGRGESLTLFERLRQVVSDTAIKVGQTALEGLEEFAKWANVDTQDQAQGSRAVNPVTSNAGGSESWSVPNWVAAPFRALGSGFGSATLRGNGGPGLYTSADVWARLERDANGTLQYAQLYADIPSSGHTARHRVWIIKRKGDVVR